MSAQKVKDTLVWTLLFGGFKLAAAHVHTITGARLHALCSVAIFTDHLQNVRSSECISAVRVPLRAVHTLTTPME